MAEDRPFTIRPGTGDDLFAIASVLVDTWRATFRGLLPDDFLDGMTPESQAIQHARRLKSPDVRYQVAIDTATGAIVGFANYGPARGKVPAETHEIYALYVHADHQARGIGKAIVGKAALDCSALGAGSLFAWVLATNPNRSFYEHMGAQAVETTMIGIGGSNVEQVAYIWADIGDLLRFTGNSDG